jgi:hypothetical protein
MALDPSSGFAAADAVTGLEDTALPIFDILPVELVFSIAADIVAGQAANHVLVIALSNGRILRIDLNKPEDIDGAPSAPRPLPSPTYTTSRC